MKANAISTVIPAYNRASFIPRAIESVLSQMDNDDELIVIDDGSKDNTADVVKRYSDRVKYIRTPNGGAGAARNRGVREAENPLVAFLDSDDEWMPGHAALLRSVMDARPELLFCYTNFATRFPDGTIRHFALESHLERELDWQEIMGPSRQLSDFMQIPGGVSDCLCFEGEHLYRSQCVSSYVSVDTLIVRREQAGMNLHFAEDTSTAEEWECGARLARAGKSAYLHCETALVNHHNAPQLTDLDVMELAAARIKIMRRVWGDDPEFLRTEGDFYRQRLREEQLLRIGRLLLRGNSRQAKLELSEITHPPLTYAMLSLLPGGLTKGLLDGRRALKSLVGHGSLEKHR